MVSRKSFYNNWKGFGMSLLFLGLLLNICNCSYSSTFNNYPDYRIYTAESSGTAIKVSSDNSYVMVGFSNGNARIYFTSGTLYAYCYGHTSPIIDIEYIPYNGWITLDSTGKAIRWNTSGTQQYTWTFSSYPTDMTLASSGGYYWIAFNFGNSVLEYNALTNSNATTKIYNAPTYTYFKRIQYPSGHSYLYAATNTSYVYQYDCYSGNYSSTYLYTYYPVFEMTQVPGGNKQTVLLNNNYILKFRNTTTADMVSYSEYANLIAASYYNSQVIYILANSNSSNYLYVHSSSGYLKQTITYNSYTIKAIDASTSNLYAVDSYGYLSIYSYTAWEPDYNPSSFPGWAIALMTSLFFFICVVGMVMMVVKARKRRQAQMINNYNRFNNDTNNPQLFPNNQPFNAPSGQQVSGNNIISQPAWNSNPQPYFNTFNQPNQPVVPPAQQNPYQANQPSNWS